MAKLMAPNIRIDWYPEGHFADTKKPTTLELNTGYNLSNTIAEGFTLDYVDPIIEDTTTIFDEYESQSILAKGYEAEIDFFLGTPRNNLYHIPEELFYGMKLPVGYLGKRWGHKWDKDYSDLDTLYTLDIYKVQADIPKITTEDSGVLLLNVKFIPKGLAYRAQTLRRLTYDQVSNLWNIYTYSQLQDTLTGKTYNSIHSELLGDENFG